jgi:hypothetical protein
VLVQSAGGAVPADCVAPADPAGAQTLARLGRGTVTVPVTPGARTVRVPIALPPGAGQGRDGRWYVARLHVRVVVSARSGDGFADVSASLNGRAAMLVELETHARPGRPPALRWSTAGLIDGREHRTGTAGHPYDIDHTNYVQLRSVHGGANQLQFRVERHGAIRIARLEVVGDSGVLPTTLAPPHLGLSIDRTARSDALVVGGLIRLPYRLVNDGGCPARDVELGIVHDRGAVGVVGPTIRRLLPLTGETRGAVALRLLAAGKQRVMIGVNSSANHPGTIVELPVRAAPASGPGRRLWVAALAAALALACSVLWWRVRRPDLARFDRGWRPRRTRRRAR